MLRWHRDLIASRHATRSRPKRPGRPRTVRSIRLLLGERAELLRKELAEVEGELSRLETAGQVVAQLLAVEGERSAAVVSESSSTPVNVAIPNRQETGGPQDLPADYQRLLETVAAADGPVRCKTICERLGLGTEPKHVEGARAKLKRLADRSWLLRNGAGAFVALT